MSDAITTLGIDPGDTTGMLLASWDRAVRKALRAKAFQCDRESAPELLRWILHSYAGIITSGQIEAFRDSRRRLHGTSAGPIRDLIQELTMTAGDAGVYLAQRPAVTVKGWATDLRLSAAGLAEVTAGQGHARDGGRHAIYAASHDCGLADPLSRKGTVPAAAIAHQMTEPADEPGPG